MKRGILIVFVCITAVFGWLLYHDNSAPTPVPTTQSVLPVSKPAVAKPVTQTPKIKALPPINAPLTIAKLILPLNFIDNDVPFTVQAPTAEWQDERQQDGCEEASSLMAMRWVEHKTISSADARREILALSDYELATYGEFRDISIEDTRVWIFNDYFKYTKITIRRDVTVNNLVAELQAGRIILAPMQGQRLHNPNFSGDGPVTHMLVIRGYDPASKEFITNDPGTKKGQGYRYKEDVIIDANLVYLTGNHLPLKSNPKGVIVVTK